jgi:hypothetical protein
VPDGVVSGRFEFSAAQARRELRGVRSDALETDAALRRVGNRLDALGKQTANIKILRTQFKGLSTDVVAAENKMAGAFKRKNAELRKQTGLVRELRKEVSGLGNDRAEAHVGVKGVAEARLEVEALRRDLRELNRQRATATASVRSRGSSSSSTSASGSGSDAAVARDVERAASGASDSLLKSASSAQLFGKSLGLLGAALPVIQALGGAVGALGASLAAAATGAAAVGSAGLAGAVVGGGGLASIIKPAISAFSGVQDAGKSLKAAQFSVTQQARAGSNLTSTQTMRAQRAAAEGLQGAQEGLIRSQEALRNSQEGLIASQERASDAQKALTQARRDALRSITDLTFATQSSQIAEKRSQIEAILARRTYLQDQADPNATREQLGLDALNVRSSNLDVKQTRVDARRNVQDLARSRRLGVDGSQSVVAARRGVRDAGYGVRDARLAARDARLAVRDAGRAVRNAAETQQDVLHPQYAAIAQAQGASAISEARIALNKAIAKAPKGTLQLVKEAKAFRASWRHATRDGGEDIVKFGRMAIQTGFHLQGVLAKSANSSAAAFLREGTQFGKFLESNVTRQFIRSGTAIFDENLKNVRLTVQNILTTFGHIVQASRPFFKEFTDWVAKSTSGWARNTSNIGLLRDRISGMVDQAKKWGHLIGETGRLLRDLFRPGMKVGGGLVDSLSGQLESWDRWAKKNPQKIEGFFKRTADQTRGIARGLVKLIGFLNGMATAMQPILGGFLRLFNILGPISKVLLPIAGAMSSVIGGSPELAAAGALLLARKKGPGAAAGAIMNPLALLGLGRGGGKAAGAGGAAAAALGGGLLANYKYLRGGQISRATSLGTALAEGGGGLRGIGGRALGAAGKFALPLALIAGGLGALSTPGTLTERVQGGLSSVTGGIIPGAITTAAARTAGGQSAAAVVGGMHQGSVSDVNRNIAMLQRLYAGNKSRSTRQTGSFLGMEFTGTIERALGADGRTKSEAAKNAEKAKVYRDALQQEINLRRQLNAQLLVQKSAAGGAKAADEIRAFGIDSKLGSKNAVGHFKVSFAEDFKKRSKEGRIALAQGVATFTATLAHGSNAQKAQARELNAYVIGKARDLGVGIANVDGLIVTGSERDWSRIRDTMGTRAEQAQERVARAFTSIQRQAVGSLQAMGLSPSEANALVNRADTSSAGAAARKASSAAGAGASADAGQANRDAAANRAAGGVRKHRARGGRMTGVGLQDTVQMSDGGWGAPGELVVNRHTENRVDQKLAAFGTSLGREVNSEQRPHSAPISPRTEQITASHFRSLGSVISAAAHIAGSGKNGSIGGTTAGLSAIIREIDSRGFHYGSTTGGRHATNSYHYRGEAVDYGDASNDMKKLWSIVYPQRKKFPELFGPSYLNPKPTLMHYGVGFQDAGLQTEHNDHIHIAFAGGAKGGHTIGGSLGSGLGTGTSGGGGIGHVRLRSVRDSLAGGVPGALIDRSSRLYASALEASINKQIDAGAVTGDGGSGKGGGKTSAGGQYNKSGLKKLWKGAGGRGASANIAAAIALAESGGNPNSQNSIGATGLWQVLRSAHPDWDHGGNLKDPKWNAKAAVSISSNGRNWNPWTTYTGADTPNHEKTYLKFMAKGGRLGARYAKGGRMGGGGGGGGLIPMYDTITGKGVPRNAQAVASYVDNYKGFSKIGSYAPNAKKVSITVTPGNFPDADIMDIEPKGHRVDEAGTVPWFQKAIAAGRRPGAYGGKGQSAAYNLPGLVTKLKKAGIERSQYNLWLADWNNSATVPAGYDAHQYKGGTNVDLNVAKPSFFSGGSGSKGSGNSGAPHASVTGYDPRSPFVGWFSGFDPAYMSQSISRMADHLAGNNKSSVMAARGKAGKHGIMHPPKHHALGGRMEEVPFDGWFAKGGSRTYNKPTMIGVGDGQASGGSETVTITRNMPGVSAGGGRNVEVTMNFGNVTMHDEKAFKHMVDDAARQVAERLDHALARAEATQT